MQYNKLLPINANGNKRDFSVVFQKYIRINET